MSAAQTTNLKTVRAKSSVFVSRAGIMTYYKYCLAYVASFLYLNSSNYSIAFCENDRPICYSKLTKAYMEVPLFAQFYRTIQPFFFCRELVSFHYKETETSKSSKRWIDIFSVLPVKLSCIQSERPSYTELKGCMVKGKYNYVVQRPLIQALKVLFSIVKENIIMAMHSGHLFVSEHAIFTILLLKL